MTRDNIQSGIAKSGVVVSGNSSGIDMYSGGTPNTKGGWVEIAPPVVNTVGAIVLYFRAGTFSNNTTSFLIDIGIGPVFGEDVVINNLICGVHINNGNLFHIVEVPINIPQGSRVIARCASNASGFGPGNLQIRISNTLLTRALQSPTGFKATRVETIGAVTGDSGGTEIDPGPTQNTKGGWIQVGAAMTRHIQWLTVGIGSRNNPNLQGIAEQALIDVGIQIGGAGPIQILIPDLSINCPQGVGMYMPMYLGGYAVNIPPGAVLFARASSTETDFTNRLFDLIYYGGY